MFQYQKIKANQKAYLSDQVKEAEELKECCGIWVVGPNGVGKSHYVRHTYGYTDKEILDKNINKWFDQWDPLSHKAVLLDDLDTSHKALGHYIKRWADKYPFECEVKGGTIGKIRPEKLFVTSQYTPKDIWSEDEALVRAIQDRFTVIDATQWPKRRNNQN